MIMTGGNFNNDVLLFVEALDLFMFSFMDIPRAWGCRANPEQASMRATLFGDSVTRILVFRFLDPIM